MKKIIISLAMIAAVAAVVVGGTTAFFSDEETSNGNTFTAGKLDLSIDIDGQMYNPLDGRPLLTAADVKPGDKGEETISIHVDDNPSCGSVAISLTDDSDNGCTEPEIGDEPNCTSDNLGELNDNLIFTVWNDEGDQMGWQGTAVDSTEGDNIKNGAYENVLTSGPLTSGKVYAFGEIAPSVAQYYGVAWELPSAVNNIAQSDTFTGSVVFKATQKRNQYDDGCPIGDITPQ